MVEGEVLRWPAGGVAVSVQFDIVKCGWESVYSEVFLVWPFKCSLVVTCGGFH